MKYKKIIFIIFWLLLLLVTVYQGLFIFKMYALVNSYSMYYCIFLSMYLSSILFWNNIKDDLYFTNKMFLRDSAFIVVYSALFAWSFLMFVFLYLTPIIAIIILPVTFKKVFLVGKKSDFEK